MKYLIRQPLLVAASVVALGLLGVLYYINAGGVHVLAVTNQQILIAQTRQNHLADYLRYLVDMETGQRGYLLTHSARYLQPYLDAQPNISSLGDALVDDYARDGDIANLKIMREVRSLTSTKLGELQSTLRLDQQAGPEKALELVKSDLGIDVLEQSRSLISKLVARETAIINDSTKSWENNLGRIRLFLIFSTLLNAILVMLSAMLVSNALGRREDRVRLLDSRLDERNRELSELSTHLQRVSEAEKSNLARELHDELGGLLVASKMDAVWLQRQWNNNNDEIQQRLRRIAHTLDEGLNLKRHIIETLRPTLLDNMGLVPALRWLVDETCGRAGLQAHARLPPEEPSLSADARIALFRITQEALTNIQKHAKARNVTVAMRVESTSLVLTIRDDGVGVPVEPSATKAHGLVNMKHRAYSLDGTCSITRDPQGGCRVTVTVPLAAAQAAESVV